MEWLQLAAKQPHFQVVFADESGFSLTPCVPYGWQAPGERYCLPSQRSSTQSIFGLLSQHNELWTYWATKSITSEFVIDCLNTFVSKSKKITLLVMDNARIHTSKAFQACLPQWEEKGLLIFYLPAYSPHLNRIERLWQKVKYEWLKAWDYANTQTLHAAIKHIFDQYGQLYNILFNEPKTSINST
jgi:transposase